MQKTLVVCVLICLFAATVLPASYHSGIEAQAESTEMNSQGDDNADLSVKWWPMFHHDPQHTGYTTATGTIVLSPVVKWSFSTNGPVKSSCAVGNIVGGTFGLQVAVGSRDGTVYVMDSNGNEVWSVPTYGPIDSSPVIADVDTSFGMEIIVGSKDGSIYVFDGATGREKWSVPTSGSVVSSPVVSDIDNDGRKEVIVGSKDGSIYVFDGATGREKWSVPTTAEIESSPAVAYGNIYIGSNDNRVYCIDGDTGDVIWCYETGGKITSSPTISGGKVYIGSWDHKLYCLDAYTGKEIWTFTTNGAIESTCAIANIDVTFGNEVVVGSNDGRVYCIDAESGTPKWSFDTHHQIKSSPAIADIDGDGKNEVVACSRDGHIYAFDSNGDVEWEYSIGAAIDSSPAIADIDGGGVEIIVGSDDGSIYVLGAPLPPKTPERPTGPTEIEYGKSYEYHTYTKDPIYKKVKYVFSWGDGKEDTTNCVDPKKGANLSHSWTKGKGKLLLYILECKGKKYCVKCKAVACDPNTGLESGWSEELPVTAKSKSFYCFHSLWFLQWLLDHLPPLHKTSENGGDQDE